MITRIRNLNQARFHARDPERSERENRLRRQYLRARALPDWAVWRATDRHIRPQTQTAVEVSVIITCYNYAAYIGAAIESVFASEREGLSLELIVVDDASTDGSAGRIQASRMAAPIPMISLRTWWNVGVSRARNLGIAKARGQYVFILDADNTLAPGALAALHTAAEAAENADAAFGPVHRVKTDGTSDGIVSNRPFDVDFLRKVENYIDAMALFRKSKLIEVGGYNVDLLRIIGGWEDYALWLELAERGSQVVFVDRRIGTYLVKPDSMVSKISRWELLQFREFAKRRYSGFTAMESLT